MFNQIDPVALMAHELGKWGCTFTILPSQALVFPSSHAVIPVLVRGLVLIMVVGYTTNKTSGVQKLYKVRES